MTGFARTSGRLDNFGWAWELRSVNSKVLDLRIRLAPGWDSLEHACKQVLTTLFKRGSVSATLTLDETAPNTTLRVNEAVLSQVLDAVQALEGRIAAAAPRLDGLLAIRGVLESVPEMEDAERLHHRGQLLLSGFQEAAEALQTARLAEGAQTHRVLAERLAEIDGLLSHAERIAAAQPAELLARFRRQMATLLDALPALPEDRLVQEAALLIARADVREELDRLSAHLAAARSLLSEGAQIGRRLDFLCQEFNREANTLCSKSADLGLTHTGLALKAAIEQLREQVQNIE